MITLTIEHLVTLIVVALAGYRLATDIAWETGPFEAYMLFRSFLTEELGAYHWISEGFNCPICLSFWTSIAMAAVYYFVSPLPVVAIAAAGLVSLIVRRSE